MKVLFDRPLDVLRQYRKLDDTVGLDGSKIILKLLTKIDLKLNYRCNQLTQIFALTDDIICKFSEYDLIFFIQSS